MWYFTSCAALHPGSVRNLSVTVEENVTLSWNPPINIQNAEEVSEYQIRFKTVGSECYNEMTVRDSCTATIEFTQESGLVSLKNYEFEVRAQSDCGEGEWEKVSAFCGMYVRMDVLPFQVLINIINSVA